MDGGSNNEVEEETFEVFCNHTVSGESVYVVGDWCGPNQSDRVEHFIVDVATMEGSHHYQLSHFIVESDCHLVQVFHQVQGWNP